MDQALVDLLQLSSSGVSREIRFTDAETGQLTVETPQGPRPYALKPMGQLYSAKPGASSIDVHDEHFMPLLLGIEQEIGRVFDDNPGMTDADVALALGALGMSLETPPPGDHLAGRIHMSLRLVLSLHDYTRQEVKLAVKKVLKSVERHTRIDGPRGYLDFNREYIPR